MSDDVPAEPDEPSASPEPGRIRPKWLVASVAGGIALVVVAAGLVGGRALGIWGDDGPVATPGPSPMPAEPVDPFAGTPAEDFAEGADGIVLPEAEPIGDFTADEVAEALELVRDALIAARLDPTVLIDHDLEPLLRLMAADHRPALEMAIDGDDLGHFPTRVDPGATLLSEQPRVSGRFSHDVATAGARDTQVLRVVTRFVWVYPFAGGLAVVRDVLVWEVRMGRPWLESTQGLWLADATARALDAGCGTEVMLGPASEGRLATDAIFDLEEPLDAVPGC